MSICIVGAGVIGLSSAIALYAQGFRDISIVSETVPPNCVSSIAGAIWEYPPYTIEPQSLACRWTLESFDVLHRLATTNELVLPSLDACDKPAVRSAVLACAPIRLHGVRVRRNVFYWPEPLTDAELAWRDQVRGFRRRHPDDVRLVDASYLEPTSGRSTAAVSDWYSFEAVVADMSIYLMWLLELALSLGISVYVEHVSTLEQLTMLQDSSDRCVGATVDTAQLVTVSQGPPQTKAATRPRSFATIVNCAGIGGSIVSGERDAMMVGAQGDLVHVYCPEIDHCFNLENHPAGMTYIIVRENGTAALICRACESWWLTLLSSMYFLLGIVACGGTRKRVASRDSQSVPAVEEPSQREYDAILARCSNFVPALRSARVLRHVSGLRPVRELVSPPPAPSSSSLQPSDVSNHQVRMEREYRGRSAIIHAYGHGGSGVVCSWGVAMQVVRLVQSTDTDGNTGQPAGTTSILNAKL